MNFWELYPSIWMWTLVFTGVIHVGMRIAHLVDRRIEKDRLERARAEEAQADVDRWAEVAKIEARNARMRANPNYGRPGYEGGRPADIVGLDPFARGGFISETAARRITGDYITTGSITTDKLTFARPLGPSSWANGAEPMVVGTDEHKAFPPRIRLTDNEICAEHGHLLAVQSTTCVRCNQRIERL